MWTDTSWCPLYAAWCRLVRPPRSVTLMLGKSGIRLSAHWTALLAAAMCSGVCQCLSLALISALCFSRTSTVSWNRVSQPQETHCTHPVMFSISKFVGLEKIYIYHKLISYNINNTFRNTHITSLFFVKFVLGLYPYFISFMPLFKCLAFFLLLFI